MLPVIILSEASAGSQITLDEMEVLNSMEAMWTAISTTVTNFFTSVLTPVINFATTNPLTLIFLGIGFIGIGIRYMRRVTNRCYWKEIVSKGQLTESKFREYWTFVVTNGDDTSMEYISDEEILANRAGTGFAPDLVGDKKTQRRLGREVKKR